MHLTRQEAEDCKALVIDSNPTSRSMLMAMLRDIGVKHVVQTSRADDARKTLEKRTFDIVICDYHFDNSPISGRDLLDDLRRSQLLPFSTVFVMVTGERSYVSVAEAAEAALDSYLIKPHSAAALEQRVLQARYRKSVLKYIFEAIEAGHFAAAAALCMQRFLDRGEFWLYAARVGAELYLRVEDHASARTLYEAVQQSQALPWAKLGLARVEVETGELPKAIRTLESLIAEQPSFGDAYDVMGRVQVEQGNLASALETYTKASAITPQNISRLQKTGMLAFLMGQSDEAISALERTVRLGLSSKMFDCQTLVMLSMLYFDQADNKGLARTVAKLTLAVERRPDSSRLVRFLRVAQVFQTLRSRKVAECVALVRELADELQQKDFDFEAATNMLAVIGRLRQTEIQLPEAEAWVSRIAKRFCVSKASSEMLCSACGSDPTYAAAIREGLHTITQMAEKAMTHSLTGSPGLAVESLLSKGGETLNAKLIELAAAVLKHHAAKISQHESMAKQINDLKQRYCTKGTQIGLGRSTGRTAGGLNLRAAEAAPA
jgi:CheY-like chemotaxis protein